MMPDYENFSDCRMDFNEWFVYDASSPTGLRWKVDRWAGPNYDKIRVRAGEVAGSLTTKGYCQVILMKRGYRIHRVIWRMLVGEIPEGMQIDHINQVKNDNRIENLRLVTNAENKRNSGKYKNNSSGVTGVRRILMGDVWYWSATWADAMKRRRAGYYSVVKYGEQEAFRMACERRAAEIVNRNLEGAGYSSTHGS